LKSYRPYSFKRFALESDSGSLDFFLAIINAYIFPCDNNATKKERKRKPSHTQFDSSLLLSVYKLLICMDDEIQGRPLSIEMFVKKQ